MHYAQATAERKQLLTAVFTTVYCRLGNILSYLRELLLKYACKHCCSSLLFGKGGSNVDVSLDGSCGYPTIPCELYCFRGKGWLQSIPIVLFIYALWRGIILDLL